MRELLVAIVFACTAGSGGVSADVVIRGDGGRLDLRATRAPLSEVLDQLARHTGMKVVYGAGAPGDLVTIECSACSEETIVKRLLEGIGVSYVFGLDRTRQHVATLVIPGASRAAPSVAKPSVAQEEGDSVAGMIVIPEPPPAVETADKTGDDARDSAAAATSSEAVESLDLGIPWASSSEPPADSMPTRDSSASPQ